MNVLVTGFAGFIGSHITEALSKRGCVIYGIDNFSRGEFNERIEKELKKNVQGFYDFRHDDILDFESVQRAVELVDVVYHMAALPSHRLALQRPRDYIEIDNMGTANILEAARFCKKPPLIVFASTNKVYGKQPCPWKEDMDLKPEGPYAVSKWSAEKMCEMYNKYFNVPCIILRYHHVAGARSNPELALSIFTKKAIENGTIDIHGTWNEGLFKPCSANYTHIDDAIRATLLAVDKYFKSNNNKFEIYNIANMIEVNVSDLAKSVRNKLKSDAFVHNVNMLPHETLQHVSDVSKARKELGFVAKIPIQKAIDDYIEWYKKYE